MASLESFPAPGSSEKRSLREIEGRLEEGTSDVLIFDEEHAYPSIVIDPEKIIKPSVMRERACDAFLEKPISVWKKAWFCWRSSGFVSALEMVSGLDSQLEPHLLKRMASRVAFVLLFLWQTYLTLYASFYPYSLLSNDEMCHEFCEALDWEKGVIRAFAWHPNYHRCALVLSNDNVYIYTSTCKSVPMLKHPLQRKVTHLAWNPKKEEVLVVACQSVLLVWTIESDLQTNRLTANCVRIVKDILPVPVTCLAFDPNGEWLSICSPSSCKVLLLKDAEEKDYRIVRHFGSGIARIGWSPDGRRLLTMTTSTFVRIFECLAWSAKKWYHESQDVFEAGCWSLPSGRFLLLASKYECSVYAIAFLDKSDANDVGGSNSCIKVLDLTERELEDGSKVGGRVNQMVWDKSGQRLVISFKDNAEHVAVFKTKTKPTLEISPVGFIHGLTGEKPLVIGFHQVFKRGSLLTIGWSSGFVSHIPLLYEPSSMQTKPVNNSTPRCLTSFCVSSPGLCSPIVSSPNKSYAFNSRASFLASDSVMSPRKPILFSSYICD